MRIAVATVQVPFVRGGAEILAEGLRDALQAQGHQAEIVSIPFKWYPPERLLDLMLACRLLDLSESACTTIDLMICLKFPTYLIPHPNKVVWLLHQHRAAYDLWEDPLGDLIPFPEGPEVRDVIHRADRKFLAEARQVFTISENVSRRLRVFCGLQARPLYHPPREADAFTCSPAEDFLFFPSRLSPTKRQTLVLEALARTHEPVCVRFAGPADVPWYVDEHCELASRLGVEDRVEWLGTVGEEEKRSLYARCLGVVFPPVDEDYGYVTLEAMLSSKPLITCADSGGPLEFVASGETGLVADPTPDALAAALDALWSDRARAAEWGRAGRARYERLGLSWSRVLAALLG